MALLQFLGYAAFIAASLALGTKLLLLWKRTREWPELTIGLSFLLGGGLGYIAWFALAAVSRGEGNPELVHTIACGGLAVTILGAISNGLGTFQIFRAGRRWPMAYIAVVACVMLFGWLGLASAAPGSDSMTFWVGLVPATALYAWGAFESWLLGSVLHKRARLGMADPVVVNRTLQWGVASACVVTMIAISFGSRLAYGPETPVWSATLTSTLGLVCAGAIWLGFFPPAAWRARLARTYGS